MSKPLNLLVDVNVWIDSYLDSRSGFEIACSFIRASLTANVTLLHTVSIEKDTFYLIKATHKQNARMQGALSEEDSLAIQAIAWACIEHMERISTPIGQDLSDLWMARKLRAAHNDLEDNLLFAAALRADVDAIVTSDQQLIKHAPDAGVLAITPEQALRMIEMME